MYVILGSVICCTKKHTLDDDDEDMTMLLVASPEIINRFNYNNPHQDDMTSYCILSGGIAAHTALISAVLSYSSAMWP